MNTGERKTWRSVLPVIQVALEVALIVFFICYAALNWAEILSVVARLSLVGLMFCMAAYSAAHFLAVAAATSLLESLGQARPYKMLLGIHWRRLPAKYLPGGIWHTVGRGSDLVGNGVPMRQVAELLTVEQLLSIWWSGFLGLALAGIAFDGEVRMVALTLSAVWIAATTLVLGWLWRSPAYARLASAVLRPRVWLSYVGGWALLASAFTAYLKVGAVTIDNPLQVAASYLVSWMLGALAFFAPQGMGVFEFAMSKAVSGPGGIESGLLWFIGAYRIVVLFADFSAWCMWLAWRQATRFF
ncbi:hypothetical protein [Thermomonas fusca]|uniref:Flippase-like domain-containing protein n=1 Tax=Thermomonas fusca TaxID=215690 RepID=A0A5R9PBI1_9GAMM|nr:hypothetical protein [Thermomonas fusca]TLX20894.1 hypothetical protein E5S66_11830 [Thermomonas fusca]